MIQFTFVTGSLDKLAEAERILAVPLKRRDMDLPEIQAVDVEEVVIHKAKYAYEALGEPVIVEDAGLFFTAWNGLPGALIKWFVKNVGSEGICKMIELFPTRVALAKTVVASYDGQVHLFTGGVQGQIALAPRGVEGFGWDDIFIPDGTVKTFAEMTPSEKNKYSMRRQAFEAMVSYYAQGREGK